MTLRLLSLSAEEPLGEWAFCYHINWIRSHLEKKRGGKKENIDNFKGNSLIFAKDVLQCLDFFISLF